jgi:abortive infection bacteriophage resistance protein
VWDLYTFDRQLRFITLDAIERVEVYMRTQLAYRLAETAGPVGYLDRSTLPSMEQGAYGHFMSRCFTAYDRSKTLFIEHFKQKYGDSHGLPPYWTLVNIMDFGMMLTLFKGSPNDVKRGIAGDLEVRAEVFESWLLTLNTVRNAWALPADGRARDFHPLEERVCSAHNGGSRN